MASAEPPAWPSGTSLTVHVHEVDRATAIDPAKIGVQFIHASAMAELMFDHLGGARPGFVDADGGAYKPLSGDGDAGVPLGQKTALLQLEGVDVATASVVMNPETAAEMSFPLQAIQQLSYGASVPPGGAYRNGAAFTFIAIGNPSAELFPEGESLNTRAFHFLAFPNDPEPGSYEP